MTAETYARLEVRRATATDLDAVLSTLEEAARWMVRQNVEGWTPEGFSRRRIAYLIEGGEMYLATLGGEPVGTFALQWDDAQTWGEFRRTPFSRSPTSEKNPSTHSAE